MILYKPTQIKIMNDLSLTTILKTAAIKTSKAAAAN